MKFEHHQACHSSKTLLFQQQHNDCTYLVISKSNKTTFAYEVFIVSTPCIGQRLHLPGNF